LIIEDACSTAPVTEIIIVLYLNLSKISVFFIPCYNYLRILSRSDLLWMRRINATRAGMMTRVKLINQIFTTVRKVTRFSALDGDSPRGKCQHWEEYCMIRKPRKPRKDEGV
jgi:hypothetical protein